MAARTDQAIVLRLSDFSETSQVATLFTPGQGQVRLIAKGARRGTARRFAVGLDLLEYGTLTYLPARGAARLGTLAEWVQRDALTGLRRELPRLYGGLYAAELVAGLTEEDDPHPGLFAHLLATLHALAGTAAPARTLAVFQAALLVALGYAPNLEHCLDCRRPRVRAAPAFFSARAGGLLCRDCEQHHVEKRRLPPGLADTTPATGPPQPWFELQDYYLAHLAGRPFRSAARLTALLRATQPGR